VFFIKKRYNIYKLITTLKPKNLIIKPIIFKSFIYKLIVDLMDFIKELNENIN